MRIMNWGEIIIAIIGLIGSAIGGGLITSIMYKKQRDVLETSNAVSASNKAMSETIGTANSTIEKSMALTQSMQEAMLNMSEDHQKVVKALKQKEKEQDHIIEMLNIRVKKMQKYIDTESNFRRKAERLICFREDCNIRDPLLGTFTSREQRIKEKEDKNETI